MTGFITTCIRSRAASLACLVVVLLSLALPPEGIPLPICQFRAITHLPCFGCGLTRSFIGMAHLRLARAALYHPLGLLLFPLTCLGAALLPFPPERRERLAAWAERRRTWWTALGLVLLVVLVGYGTARIAWLKMTGQPSLW